MSGTIDISPRARNCQVSNPPTGGTKKKARTPRAAKQKVKMNRRNRVVKPRARSKIFWASKFMQYEDVETSDNPELGFGDLDNAIHPVFREQNFGKLDYRVIEPSLQLETLMLQAEPLQRFFSTIVNRTKLWHLPERHPDGGRRYGYSQEDSRNPPLGIDAQKRAKQALVNLADIVHFRSGKRVFGALTKPVDDWTCPEFPSGRGSKIQYSWSLYSVLCRTTYAEDGNLVHLLACQFEFALQFAHEVCHALVNAVEGDLNSEPFFYDTLVSEVGFEMEARLFGGHLEYQFGDENNDYDDEWNDGFGVRRHYYPGDNHFSNLRGILLMWEWPYRHVIDSYRGTNDYLDVQDEDQIPEVDLAWRVNTDFVAKFFTKNFWETEVKQLGAAAFRPPKEVGYYFVADNDGKIQPHRPDKRFLPSGCKVGEKGIVISA